MNSTFVMPKKFLCLFVSIDETCNGTDGTAETVDFSRWICFEKATTVLKAGEVMASIFCDLKRSQGFAMPNYQFTHRTG